MSVAHACTGSCTPDGELRYCSGVMKFCSAAAWKTITATASGVSCTTAGAVDYASNQLRFCNGSTWQIMYDTGAPITNGSCSTGGGVYWDSGNARLQFCNGTNNIGMPGT